MKKNFLHLILLVAFCALMFYGCSPAENTNPDHENSSDASMPNSSDTGIELPDVEL